MDNKKMKILKNKSGITIAEILVSVVLIMLAVSMLVQVVLFISSEVSHQARESKAISIASTNLNKYLDSNELPVGFDCNSHHDDRQAFIALDNDSSNIEEKPEGNWNTLNQQVKIYSENGCNGPTTVQSVVEYGNGTSLRKVVQVAYAL